MAKSLPSRIVHVVPAFILAWSACAQAATVTLHPNLDNTIYSESGNSNATGGLFSGVTNGGNIRRALMEFDMASGGIPAGSVILSVSLSVTQTKIGPAGAANFELRPLLAAWGEGSSNGSGTGSPATSGDATWNFRMFNTDSWSSPGGDFGSASATTSMGTALNTYTFNSTPNLVADVQGWLDSPASNFGWLLRASSESGTSAREFGSRESALAQQPSLVITYTPAPEPSAAGLSAMAAACAVLRRRRGTAKRPDVR